MANQAMERALAVRGLRSEARVGRRRSRRQARDAGLSRRDEVALEGLARKPVKAGLGSPQMKEILIPGEDWKLVGEGYKFTEGPATNAKGEVFFNDVGASEDLQDRRWQAGRLARGVEARRRPAFRPGREALRERRGREQDSRVGRGGQVRPSSPRLQGQRPRRSARRRRSTSPIRSRRRTTARSTTSARRARRRSSIPG